MLKIILIFFIVFITVVISNGCRVADISNVVVDDISDNLKIDPFVKVGKKFYYFGETKVHWFKASLKCRDIDGYLASVESKQEFEELTKYMSPKYDKDIWWWLSGADLGSPKNFFWHRTGNPITYGWTGGQPDNAFGDEHCVGLWYQNNRHELNDLGCNHELLYICEVDKPKSISLTVF